MSPQVINGFYIACPGPAGSPPILFLCDARSARGFDGSERCELLDSALCTAITRTATYILKARVALNAVRAPRW